MEVLLYDEGTTGELNIEEIARYLREKTGKVETEVRGNPFSFYLTRDKISDYARKIAGTKIQDANKRVSTEQELLYGEIEYEKRRITGKSKSFGILYDGLYLQRLFLEILPVAARRLESAHIIFTNRLFATWDDRNKRYHVRTSIYGIPSIISTSGLVEAPAKPREYYLLKQQYDRFRKSDIDLKEKFRGRFIDYEDKRLTEVAKGYVMQAIFYCLTGEPFCEDKGCRLYNAHWQEELIFAQLESKYEFCPRHTRLLKEKLS